MAISKHRTLPPFSVSQISVHEMKLQTSCRLGTKSSQELWSPTGTKIAMFISRFRTVLHVLWFLNLLTSHLSWDLCTGSRLMNALNINYSHSPTKFLQPANLTTYTISSLFSLQVELAPRLLSP